MKIEHLLSDLSRTTRGILPVILLLSFFALSSFAQQREAPIRTNPALVENTVSMQVGNMLEISVPATLPGTTYRIQRTYPADNAYLDVKSDGGLLKIPAFKVNASGKQLITVAQTNGDFAYTFILVAKPGLGMNANGLSLFGEGTGGLMYGNRSGETVTANPDITLGIPDYININCFGTPVLVTVSDAEIGTTYTLQRTSPPTTTAQEITATSGTVNFEAIVPTLAYGIWTVQSNPIGFGYSFAI
ncbi:MAG: hypothetical protein RBS33_10870, partial [Lentimicrobium sp.]|nr:hypothetical protein [Lentimicrobium sp.]